MTGNFIPRWDAKRTRRCNSKKKRIACDSSDDYVDDFSMVQSFVKFLLHSSPITFFVMAFLFNFVPSFSLTAVSLQLSS